MPLCRLPNGCISSCCAWEDPLLAIALRDHHLAAAASMASRYLGMC